MCCVVLIKYELTAILCPVVIKYILLLQSIVIKTYFSWSSFFLTHLKIMISVKKITYLLFFVVLGGMMRLVGCFS
jgi:hypothetical protein